MCATIYSRLFGMVSGIWEDFERFRLFVFLTVRFHCTLPEHIESLMRDVVQVSICQLICSFTRLIGELSAFYRLFFLSPLLGVL